MEECITCGHDWYHHPPEDGSWDFGPHCINYNWEEQYNPETGITDTVLMPCYCTALAIAE